MTHTAIRSPRRLSLRFTSELLAWKRTRMDCNKCAFFMYNVSSDVYIYIYIYTCIYIYYTYVYVCVYIYIYVCVYVQHYSIFLGSRNQPYDMLGSHFWSLGDLPRLISCTPRHPIGAKNPSCNGRRRRGPAGSVGIWTAFLSGWSMSQCFTSPKYWGYFISNRCLKVM